MIHSFIETITAHTYQGFSWRNWGGGRGETRCTRPHCTATPTFTKSMSSTINIIIATAYFGGGEVAYHGFPPPGKTMHMPSISQD